MSKFTLLPSRLTAALAGLFLLILGGRQQAAAQVGIGTTTPNAKAVLDLQSSGNDKGLLIPRLTNVQRLAMTSVPDGLMIFQTDGTTGFWYYFGGAWTNIPNAGTAGDNLGNHTATTNLNLAGNKLVGNGGSSGIAIDNTGRVGINTTSAAAKLDIQGGADGTGLNDPFALAFSWRNGGYRHWVRSRHNSSLSGIGNDLDFYLNNSSTSAGSSAPTVGTTHVLTMESFAGSPRVGIGTTAPSQALDVTGSAIVSNRLGIGTTAPSQALDVTGTALVSGNVGIGTTAPSEKLHVEAGSVFVNGEGQGVIIDSQGAKRIGLLKYTGHEAGIWRTVDANNLFEIGRVQGVTSLPGTPTGYLTDLSVNNSGYVGIGTASADRPLTVQGSGINSELLSFKNSSGTTKWHWNLGNSGVNLAETGVADGRLFMAPGGNLGIGTMSPSATLHVSGGSSSVRLEGLSGSGSRVVVADASGNLTATAALPTGESTTASNGLTKTGTDVALGGTLSSATTIANGGNNFNISGSGNVGIGTTSPAAKLDVSGAIGVSSGDGDKIYLTSALSTGSKIAHSLGWSVDYYAGPSANDNLRGYHRFFTTGAGVYEERLRIDNLGRVGIGTTSPARKLEVGTTSDDDGVRVSNSARSTNVGLLTNASGPYLSFFNGSSNGTGMTGWIQQRPGTDANPDHIDYHNNNGTTHSFTANAGVRVGIGTTAPATTLHVTGTAGTSNVRLESLAGSGTRLVTTDASGNLGSTATISGESTTASNGLTKTGTDVALGGTLSQATTIANGGNNFNISGSGNVGIGTTSPDYKLQVDGGSVLLHGEDQGLIVDEGPYRRTGLIKYAGHATGLWHADGIQLEFGRVQGAGFTLPGSPTSLVVDMTLDSDGDVGIGVSNPAARLHVAGTAGTSNVRLESLAGTGTRMVTADASGNLSSTTLPTDAQQLSISGSTISLTNGGSVVVPSSADNLGNHTATANVNLGTNQLVGNGGNSGIYVSSAGNVAIGTTIPNGYRLNVNGNSNVTGTLNVTGEATLAGIRLPGSFAADATYVGLTGNSISFAHSGFSEDFIGYKNNTFYLKDSPGGSDSVDPNLVIGGKVGIGTSSAPTATLEVAGTTSTVKLEGLSGTGTRVVTADASGNLSAAGIISGESTTASNGLTKTGNDVALGGTLSQATTVDLNGNNFGFTGSGNVGLGTSSPGAKLDVNGSILSSGTLGLNSGDGDKIYLTNALGAGSKIGHSIGWSVDNYAGPGTASTGDRGIFRFFTTNASGGYLERMRLSAAGNVGIGTTTPSEKLSVAGNATVSGTATASTFTFPATSNDLGPVITSREVPTDQGAVNPGLQTELILFHGNDGNTNVGGPDQITLRAPKLNFQTFNNTTVNNVGDANGYNERLSIDPEGLVKINTLAGSGSRVVVADASGNLSAAGTITGESTTASNGLTKTGTDVALGGTLTGATTVALGGNNLGFTGSGNVGIGVASPDARLQVEGSETALHGFGAAITLKNSAATLANSWHLRAGGSGTATQDGGFSIADGTNYLMQLTSTGRVGIMTTTPSATLDVNGTARVRTLSATGTRMVTADANGNLGNAALPTDAQTLSKSGSTISLTNGGSVTDSDAQTLSIVGSTISLTNGGSVVVPSSADNLGNHTATTTLNLGSNALAGNGGTTGITIASNGNVTTVGQLSTGSTANLVGIKLPGAFDPDATYVGATGNSISFGHTGISEDFIGYKANTFYLRDSPGGSDGAEPNLNVGGLAGTGTRMVTADASGTLSTSTVPTSENTTAGNGLTLTGTAVQLGGTLSQATTIAQGSNNLSFTGTGNVGIGTTPGAYKLHVLGTSRLEGNAQTTGSFQLNSTDGEKIILTDAGSTGSKISHSTGWSIDNYAGPGNTATTGQHRFFTTASNAYQERLRIQGDGNVGIGTTAPQAKLHVSGGSIGLDYGQAITVSPETSWPSGTHDLVRTDWTGSADRVRFYTPGSVNATAKLSLLSNGGVNLLGLAGSGSRVVVADASGNLTATAALPTGESTTASNGLTVTGTDVALGGTLSAATTIANGGNALSVTGTGNVAIGAAAGTAKLLVSGTSSEVTLLQGSNTLGSWLGLSNSSTGGRRWNLVSTGSANGEGAGALLIRDETAGAVRAMFDTNGNLGLGTTSTSGYKLTVAGGNTRIAAVGNEQSLFGVDQIVGYNDLRFYTDDAGTTERLRIENNGNVGVGTTIPTSTLQVNGSEALSYTDTGSNTSFTLTSAHRTLRRFGTCSTITLPMASTCPGRLYTIINSNGQGSFTLSVTGGGSVYDDIANQTFSGTNAFPAATRLTVQSDGSGWIVVGR